MKAEPTAAGLPAARTGSRAWQLPLLAGTAYVAALVVANAVVSLPDSIDFEGLGRIGLLMERYGWKYCINHNWGFANPLLHSALTRVTGSLFVAQRILAAVFTLAALVLLERVMTRTLGITSERIKAWVLVWAALSPWMILALVSVHLDIASIAFVLAGLAMVRTPRLAGHVLAGFLVGVAYWFRFHYLAFALLYPVLVAILRWDNRPLRRGAAALVGAVAAVGVPHLLCYAAFGVSSLSNQKAILALLADDFSESVSYGLRLENLSYGDLFKHISWYAPLRQFALACLTRPAFTLFLVLAAWLILGAARSEWLRRPARELRTWGQTLVRAARQPAVAVVLYLLASGLPFVFLRGLPVRLEAVFLLPATPVLAWVLQRGERLQRWLLALPLMLGALAISVAFLRYQHERVERLRDLDAEIRSVVLATVLRDHPERVLVLAEYFNPYDRYMLCTPAVTGHWLVGSKPMREHFGVVDSATLHRDGAYRRFSYIVLLRGPWEAYHRYDPELLNVPARIIRLPHTTIIVTASVDAALLPGEKHDLNQHQEDPSPPQGD